MAREEKKNNKQLKDCREHFQAEAKAKDVSLENMTVEKKRLHEEVKAERSKCNELREKVQRWREMTGRKCLVQLLPHCRPRYKNLDFVWDFQILS